MLQLLTKMIVILNPKKAQSRQFPHFAKDIRVNIETISSGVKSNLVTIANRLVGYISDRDDGLDWLQVSAEEKYGDSENPVAPCRNHGARRY
jgi:hypothetical protein